ncbi:MarP family serine protease [uncultured Schumannella sp.]|uniref:MarP family serine protease n=1 Tax=uncultured Schumannella sp. TaxID=1195956 RepID=UPI0025E5651F|nr:MarP family serine protease [uncultured Schumannella sp.]
MTAALVLDVILVVVLVGFLISGLRHGLARSLGSILGLAAGGVAAFLLAPILTGIVPWPFWRVFFVVTAAVFLLIVGHSIGRAIGRLIGRGVDRTALRPLDRMLGGAATLVTAALVTSLLAGSMTALGAPVLSRAANDSAVISGIERLTPDPVDSALARLRSLILADGVPVLGQGLGGVATAPSAAPEVETATDPLIAASASVVRITGTAYACGQNQSGSGFVIASNRIVTNAHVVAGVDQPVVEAPNGQSIEGRVVYFDARDDLAVIATIGLDVPPLALNEPLAIGDESVVQGYPFGGPFVSDGAEVLAVSTERLRDIYGGQTSEREVYTLAAEINPGNSGGPLLALDGEVAGVVFAKSADSSQLGYAMTNTELAPVADAAPGLSAQVSSGSCVAG